jgi:hypothetical protein
METILSSILLVPLLVVYPLSMFLLPAPMAFKWMRSHGSEPMPDAMRSALLEDSRIWYFVPLSIVAFVLFLWTLYKPVLHEQLLGAVKEPLHHSVEGITVAVILMLLRFGYVMQPYFRVNRLQEHSFASGSLTLWLLTFIVAGAVEEVWRACCIFSVQAVGAGSIVSIGGTTLAFVFAHMSGIPGRMVGIREELLWEILFGVALGSLFLWLGNLVAPYVASLLFNVFNLFLIRTMRR